MCARMCMCVHVHKWCGGSWFHNKGDKSTCCLGLLPCQRKVAHGGGRQMCCMLLAITVAMEDRIGVGRGLLERDLGARVGTAAPSGESWRTARPCDQAAVANEAGHNSITCLMHRVCRDRATEGRAERGKYRRTQWRKWAEAGTVSFSLLSLSLFPILFSSSSRKCY